MQLNLLTDVELAATSPKSKTSPASKVKKADNATPSSALENDLFGNLPPDSSLEVPAEVTPTEKPLVEKSKIENSEVDSVEEPHKKSTSAFKTISEVANIFSVPQHVLRFWESKFTQIKPVKSGGGRRYYRPEDVDIIGRIYNLLYKQGYTIKGAKKAMSAKDVEDLEIADVDSDMPVLNEKQKKQVSAILQELLNSREVLKEYLSDEISA